MHNNSDSAILYRKSLELMLLYCLMNNHFEYTYIPSVQKQASNPERAHAALVFIQQHYQEQISLKDLGRQLHLSASYLGKFFKQTFGQSFYQYLNSYRVDCSLGDLLYTRCTITDLALSYGFPNTNSYIDFFRKKFQCTPNAYRQRHAQKDIPASESQMLPLPKQIHELLSPYIKNETTGLALHNSNSSQKCSADAIGSLGAVVPLWQSGMNISHAKSLIRHPIVRELEIVSQRLAPTYARFFFSLNRDFLMPSPEKGQYNFYYFTRSINLLLDHGFKPYLDLRRDILMPEPVVDTEEYLNLLEKLLIYTINTFGRQEAGQWIWEIGICCNFISLMLEDLEHFVRRFICAYQLIKEHLPEAKVGGIGLFSAFPAQLYQDILTRLIQENVYPDFVSMEIFPYYQAPRNQDVCVAYSQDPSYALHYVRQVKEQLYMAIGDSNFCPRLYVSSLGICIRDRSYIVDTCYQSTFLIKNTLDLIGEVDLICYFQMSDGNFSFYEDQRLLDGRNGLLAQFDLPKPGFLALELMGQMSGELLSKGSNYMILKQSWDKYTILMCNHPCIRAEHCLNIGKPLAAENAYTVFEDFEDIQMSIVLEHLKDGDYQITSSHINREHGSIFDEWARSSYTAWTDRSYLSYLKQILCPQKLFTQKTSINGQLHFDLCLKPLEVILIEITYMVRTK